MISNWESIILGIVEGLTEFLPISSTAHLIIAEKILNLESTKFLNFFTIFIQMGAISAVPLLYFKRLTTDLRLYQFITYSFIPAAILGVLLDDILEAMFEGYWFIAFSWLLGGIILVYIDKWLKKDDVKNPENDSLNLLDDLTVVKAIKIGFFQCIAMIPGVSRSGASIIGARVVGLSHKSAVEYSFLLGIPTIFGACSKKIYDYRDDLPLLLNSANTISLILGFVISFIIALVTIKFMVGFVQKYGFKPFGIYRIVIGILLFIYLSWS
jgi:undecaprenyl-diphosphatase